MARINEWYGLHFPELENLVKDSNVYFKFVSLGLDRTSITEKELTLIEDSIQDENHAEETAAVESSTEEN